MKALQEETQLIVWVKRTTLIDLVGREVANDLLPALPERIAVNRLQTLKAIGPEWLQTTNSNSTTEEPLT